MENSYYIYNISNILKRKETTVLNAIPGTDNELNSVEGYNTHAAGSYGNHAEGISTITVGI